MLAIGQHMETSAAKAFAAAGQFELMSLLNALMSPKGVTASQILLTQNDFDDEYHIKNLCYAVDRLLALGIVPIINENDAVSVVPSHEIGDPVFSDNDSLAALCARTFNAEVLILLTDVDGVYDLPPSNPKAKIIPYYYEESSVSVGEKSTQGRGGMSAKLAAAQSAVMTGSACVACVVASGNDLNSVRSILARKYDPVKFGDTPKGTLFATPGSDLAKKALDELVLAFDEDDSCAEHTKVLASAARREARKLATLSVEMRRSILHAIADALGDHQDDILQANREDLEQARASTIDKQLMNRLTLTPEKISTLQNGIREICGMEDPLNVIKNKRELANGLELSLITVPIGVLLFIFESRPDSLPQIVSLAIASGNGLLLKGGKEAARSNEALHQVIGCAIESGSNGEISRDIVALTTSSGQVKELLSLEDDIDLVIPRGSNALVSFIKANTRIPTPTASATAVCHCYVDASAKAEEACKIVVDAKTDFPSACNAMETLLLHRTTVKNGVALRILQALRSAGVKCLGGPKAMDAGLSDIATLVSKCDYGDLTCLVEVVENMDEAIDWIHANGSGHAETIVCDDKADPIIGEEFLSKVDSACVFKNASTRFADGYRVGLGAEVGIWTGRMHARGPVGVEGLLSTKWQLRATNSNVHCVGEFGGEQPSKHYTHKQLL